MNNRIPSVVRDFNGTPQTKSILAFLAFEDWLGAREHEAPDWLTAAASICNETDYFTFSAMASAEPGNREKLLSRHDWDVDLTFGQPYFYSIGLSKAAIYNDGLSKEVDGVTFRPFVRWREFNGYEPSRFELDQTFLLYHNAFFVPEKNEYQVVDKDGEIGTLSRLKSEKNTKMIQVDVHSLRDYLAATRSYLVRYHDHRREAVEDIGPHIGGSFASFRIGDNSSKFDLWLRTDIPHRDKKSASRLLGKDIVEPYLEPAKHRTSFATGNDEQERFAKFIIGRDKEGKEIEETCDESLLSNYFSDRGRPHYLTPVFFDRKVLSKYYQEPTRFSVTDSGVGCLNIWSIPADVTDEGLVQVWLGDLGRMPYKEQLHWSQFNVAPKGTITRHRWMRDFMAEFADPIGDPMHDFHSAYEEVQREMEKRHGTGLFLKLHEKDQHAYVTIRIPLTEEWKELDEQVQSLAKITVDSIDVGLLRRLTGKSIDGTSIKGSLDLLSVYLGSIGAGNPTRIIEPLKTLQTLRSTSSAHRKGTEFDKFVRKSGLEKLSNRDKARNLIVGVNGALSLIAAELRNTSDGHARTTPDHR